MYINEIIRITYKCNWKCKFCNVLKTNNFWENDISKDEVVFSILQLYKKYSAKQRGYLTLSFSWWEPTLNTNLWNYIRLAKSIWVWNIQLQTNWSLIYRTPEVLLRFIDSWLDEIFIANHSHLGTINKEMWAFWNEEDFLRFIDFYKRKKIKLKVYFNIVINKINIFNTRNFIIFLKNSWFIDILNSNMLSFWFVQDNWYAEINSNEVLLKYIDNEVEEVYGIVNFCKENNITPDFHFTSPPICILNYPEYNLEYKTLKNLEYNKLKWFKNKSNLESYKFLWKEKRKFIECKKCKYNKYCLWFYKNWIKFVWKWFAIEKIRNFVLKS